MSFNVCTSLEISWPKILLIKFEIHINIVNFRAELFAVKCLQHNGLETMK